MFKIPALPHTTPRAGWGATRRRPAFSMGYPDPLARSPEAQHARPEIGRRATRRIRLPERPWHRVILLAPVQNHGPEGDEGTPEAFVETHRVMREPVGQGGQGEETGEERERPRRAECGNGAPTYPRTWLAHAPKKKSPSPAAEGILRQP